MTSLEVESCTTVTEDVVKATTKHRLQRTSDVQQRSTVVTMVDVISPLFRHAGGH